MKKIALGLSFVLSALSGCSVESAFAEPVTESADLSRLSAPSSGVSPADRATALRLFNDDGLMIALTRYYTARGFTSGAPQVSARPDLRYCPDSHTCSDVFDVVLPLSRASERREVRAVVEIGRFAPYFAFLFDRYDNRTVAPVTFVGALGDRAMSIFQGSGEPLAMWINHAGLSTPGADSGGSRNTPTFYVENLRCMNDVCIATFVSGAKFTFDADASGEIVERLRTAPVTPVTTAAGELYETQLVDCGPYYEMNPGSSECWVIAR